MLKLVWYLVLCQTVLFGSDKQVVATEETQYVRDGEDVTLSCSGVMNVVAKWYYKQNDQSLSVLVAEDGATSDPNKYSVLYNPNNRIYDLTVHEFIATSDAGLYTCRLLLNNILQKEVIITTVISEGPTTASITGNSPVFADGSTSQLTLTCTATAIPAVTFEWRNRGDITGGGTGTLTLSPVQASDNGANITCTAMNSEYNDMRTSHSVTLTVYYGPDSVVVTGNSTVYADGINTLALTCEAISVNPGVSFQWSKDGTSIGNNSSTLTFTPVPADDGKEVVCTATNTQHQGSQATGNVILTVYYPPDVRVMYGNTTETDKGTTITCIAAGKPHSYNFYPWKHIAPDGETVIRELRGNHTEEQYTLTFRDSVSYEDSGYYRCTVNNGVTGLSPYLNRTEMSGYFIVEGPPKILEKEDSIHGELGIEVNIEMQFYSVPGYTSVKWYILDGSHVTDTHNYNTKQSTLETTFHGQSVNVSGYITTLKLNNVTANDFLRYRVVVNNTKGSSSFDKTLKRISEPCTPGNEMFKVLDEHTIKISWSAGCNGGAKQTFHVEYKKTTSTEWTQFPTIEENENNKIYSVSISDLEPGTKYDIRILAKNLKGQSDYILLSSATADEEKSTPLGGIIGGVAGGLVVIVICIIVVVLFMRRRRSTKEKKSDVETSNSYGSRNHLYPVEASTENPMYVKSDVSAEPEPEYSELKKVNKLPATDVHSQDKKKGGETNKKKVNVKTATPHDKDVLVDGARGGENDYKNTASNKSNETEELRNADGLLYADLASAKRKHRDPPLIRGVENTTDYAAIDFTKRAPAPPKEDEGETQN